MKKTQEGKRKKDCVKETLKCTTEKKSTTGTGALGFSLQYPQGFEADFTSLIHFYGKKTTTATNKFFTNTDITINATF